MARQLVEPLSGSAAGFHVALECPRHVRRPSCGLVADDLGRVDALPEWQRVRRKPLSVPRFAVIANGTVLMRDGGDR
jgi:hypothetical protein